MLPVGDVARLFFVLARPLQHGFAALTVLPARFGFLSR